MDSDSMLKPSLEDRQQICATKRVIINYKEAIKLAVNIESHEVDLSLNGRKKTSVAMVLEKILAYRGHYGIIGQREKWAGFLRANKKMLMVIR